MKVVMCHGVFDVLHIGHVRHLQEARSLGDYLVVSVTADRFVYKGAGRPWNTLDDRMKVLWALRCVDRVMASEAPSSVANIGTVRPAIYCKGADYADKGLRDAEIAACALVGAEIRYTTAKKTSITEIMERQCALS